MRADFLFPKGSMSNSASPNPGPKPPSNFYLIYVDDSGDANHDLLVAVCVPATCWSTSLAKWKQYRKFLHRKFLFPPVLELHATEWLRRRDLHLTDPDSGEAIVVPREVPRGSGARTRDDAFVNGLKTVAAMRDVRIVGVYERVANGAGGLYPRLLGLLEDFLAAENSFGVVWFDGTSKAGEASFRQHHRALEIGSRRVLEDPIPLDSRHSHFIQIADVVAYAMFANVRFGVNGKGRPVVANGYRELSAQFVPLNGDDGLAGFCKPAKQ
jgi:Protein of unknown function (DUF3800)